MEENKKLGVMRFGTVDPNEGFVEQTKPTYNLTQTVSYLQEEPELFITTHDGSKESVRRGRKPKQ